jgi:phosphopantothenoylcysteine decarboxylase/phosphopantothenate--cysteine ligase
MKIALGVTGGIAAYKAAELVRRLQQDHLEVQVVMTRAAQQFIQPLTFAALTGEKVITDMFAPEGGGPANVESAIEHIAVAQRIRLLVIAPGTADILAKLAHGIADDFLTTLALATRAPLVVAPAMNVNMWAHAATQENVATLRARGVHIVEPDEGYLACGMTGPGRLAGTETIARKVADVLGLRRDLAGETVLVTAGPTREPVDPVRYLSNRSSGKMGYAMAEAAVRRGARVILVSGPTALEPPSGVEVVRVETAEEMHRAVLARIAESTVLVKAAAVADYRPAAPQARKIKRTAGATVLELEGTPDILADLSREKGKRYFIGFAAETEDLAENARKKLEAKRVDMVVANDVTQEGAGFDGDSNVVTLFTAAGAPVEVPRMSKLDVAHRIYDEMLKATQDAERRTLKKS